jgi:hypothetical protein
MSEIPTIQLTDEAPPVEVAPANPEPPRAPFGFYEVSYPLVIKCATYIKVDRATGKVVESGAGLRGLVGRPFNEIQLHNYQTKYKPLTEAEYVEAVAARDVDRHVDRHLESGLVGEDTARAIR